MRDPGERHSTCRGPAKGPGCESTQVPGPAGEWGSVLGFLGIPESEEHPVAVMI